LSKNMN